MMKLSPKMWYLLKYGFLAMIVGGIFVSVLPASKPASKTEDESYIQDMLSGNSSDSYIDDRRTLETLRNDVTDCITKAIRENTIGTEKEDESFFYDKSQLNVTTKDVKFDHTTFAVLTTFNNLLSLLNIRTVIIEPSVLYCMLLPKYQELLLKRYFNLSEISKSNNILTYAVLEKDVIPLQEKENIYKFTEIGFQPLFVQRPLTDWMQKKDIFFGFESFPSHIFYKNKLCTIHIVVFYERNNYYWHAAINSENNKIPPKENFLFVDYDSAYEKFAFVSLENKVLPLAEFYVPSNTHYFLHEMMSSRFLECNFSRAANVYSRKLPKSHPEMSVERFNRRTLIALRELKTIFHPLLMHFWIWSGTMLGWYRQCDIIPYTTDVDFAAWASEVEALDEIINLLVDNKYITIKQRMGLLEEALEFQLDCHKLRTDVFFVYQIRNGTWYSGHSPKHGYYFRYFMPNFTLCSAELLGEKVHVPCETEKVIASEYGHDWSKPAAKWNYESSSKGRGPNIFWKDTILKNAYQVY